MKNKLGHFLIFFFIIFSRTIFLNAQTKDSNDIQKYVDHIEKKGQTPTDYIMSLFETHDIVILCERIHLEVTQYEMILNLISDKRFIDNVGHIFTEVGVSSLAKEFDSYLIESKNSDAETKEQLLNIYRNISFHPVWNKTNFYNFLQNTRILNQSLPKANKIHIYPSDVPFSWQEMNKEKYSNFQKILRNRDKIMAEQIQNSFSDIVNSKGNRKKALVIMNYRHAFPHISYMRKNKTRQISNVGGFLMAAYPGKVANVMINSIRLLQGTTDNKAKFTVIADGKWDAAFRKLGNPDTGFSFDNSPFGQDPFDYLPVKTDLNYQNVFTGLVFYKPLHQHQMSSGIPGLVDEQFHAELVKRYQLTGDKRTEKEINKNIIEINLIKEFGYENEELFGESDYQKHILKWLK